MHALVRALKVQGCGDSVQHVHAPLNVAFHSYIPDIYYKFHKGRGEGASIINLLDMSMHAEIQIIL